MQYSSSTQPVKLSLIKKEDTFKMPSNLNLKLKCLHYLFISLNPAFAGAFTMDRIHISLFGTLVP